MSVTQTSLLAFKQLNPVRVGTRQYQVQEAIREYGPVTDKQLSELTGLPINVVTPRRGELYYKGLIRKVSDEELKISGVKQPSIKSTFWALKEPVWDVE